MDALARQDVGQRDARRLDPHPHLARSRLGALLLEHLDHLGPAIPRDDDARVSHRGWATLIALATKP